MSELLTDIGDYRGRATGGAVSTTTNGFPQLVLELHATDVYDGDNDEWYPDAVDGVITAYICLFGGNGKATLGVQQVMDAFGWDGASFGGLNELVKDLTSRPEGMSIGFSTESNEYEGNVRTQVSWVRAHDAAPGRTIRECTTDELKNLDKQYAHGLQAVKSKAKVAAPKPATALKPPTQLALQKGVSTGTQTATQAEATPPPATRPAPSATGKSTKGKAWGKFTTANRAEAVAGKSGGGAGFDDKQLGEIWLTEIQKVVGKSDVEPSSTTNEGRQQWYQIQDACVVMVTLPF